MKRSPPCVCVTLFAVAAPAWAQTSIGVSTTPDTKTHFVWAGAERKENRDKTLYLVVEHGSQKTGTSVSDEIDVRFARAEVGKIKWCSYVGKDLELGKCKPSQALKPDGVITIK